MCDSNNILVGHTFTNICDAFDIECKVKIPFAGVAFAYHTQSHMLHTRARTWPQMGISYKMYIHVVLAAVAHAQPGHAKGESGEARGRTARNVFNQSTRMSRGSRPLPMQTYRRSTMMRTRMQMLCILRLPTMCRSAPRRRRPIK